MASQTKKQKKKRKKDEEELLLESLVFGTSLDQDKLGHEIGALQVEATSKTEPTINDESLFIIDRSGDIEPVVKKKKKSKQKKIEIVKNQSRKPAWKDVDDEKVVIDISNQPRLRKLRKAASEQKISGSEYAKRLVKKFNELHASAEWADPETSKKVDEDFLQSTKPLSRKDGSQLSPGILGITRMKDCNLAERSKSIVSSVKFHPSGQLVMTAGLDKSIRLFQVDGVRNPKVQGIFLQDLPIFTAAFSKDGREIIASGRRKYFYSLDLSHGSVHKVPQIRGRDEKSLERFVLSPDGKYINFFGNNGYLIQVDFKSKQWIHNFKMNGSVRAVDYSHDAKYCYSIGGDGEVYIWDIRTQRCIYKHADDGCIHGTALAVSKTDDYYATGSDSGVVNVYSSKTWRQNRKQTLTTLPQQESAESEESESESDSDDDGNSKQEKQKTIQKQKTNISEMTQKPPVPLKNLMQLTTPIDHILFNSDSQLLAIASRRKKDALRMIHLPSMTCFTNWPTGQTPLRYISAMDFSPNSGYFAVGNDRGHALLYRLNHYSLS